MESLSLGRPILCIYTQRLLWRIQFAPSHRAGQVLGTVLAHDSIKRSRSRQGLALITVTTLIELLVGTRQWGNGMRFL